MICKCLYVKQTENLMYAFINTIGTVTVIEMSLLYFKRPVASIAPHLCFICVFSFGAWRKLDNLLTASLQNQKMCSQNLPN